MKLTSAKLVRAAALLATLAIPVQGVFAQNGTTGATTDAAVAPAASSTTLSAYWPFNMASRTWSLVNARGIPSMTVTNATTGTNTLDLVFTHAARATTNGGGFNAGAQRYCDNSGNPFLFLDGYSFFNADGAPNEQHSVTSTRLILTPQGGKPVDLIANGTYARCGNKGQPYLLWNLSTHQYRLQAWGFLTGHMQNRWYWDVTVNGPTTLAKDPCGMQSPLNVVAVQEAWWSNFNGLARWGYGNGAVGADGVPTGATVSYGRTDYHANGHLPWYMVASSDGNVMCTHSVANGTTLPLQRLTN